MSTHRWPTALGRPVEERFWEKVDRSGGANTCWPWQSTLIHSGYGQFAYKGKNVLAHRFAYVLTHGAIPEGKEIDHVKDRGCTQRSCCNPAHMEPVSKRVNTLRGSSFSAINARKTHCNRGHEFTVENTETESTGSRRCRTCRELRNAARRKGLPLPAHCKHGHAYSPENTAIKTNGSRVCRACARHRNRLFMARKRHAA